MPETCDYVCEISNQGWLQGDMVPGEALAGHIPQAVLDAQFEGGMPSHWILISHSCTVHARKHEDAPIVEWLACKLVKKKPYGKYLNALNPRQLHLQLDDKVHLDLKIQRRVWTARSALIELERVPDTQQLSEEQREAIAYWLAHGYTRIAMPDELVERLKLRDADGKPEGLGTHIDSFLEQNSARLDSAWVSFYPKSELKDVSEPYEISFRFLIKNTYRRELQSAQEELDKALSNCADIGAGLTLDLAQVSVLEDFSMLDAKDYTRYNLHDWLSLGDQQCDPQDE
ncbi:hypothetical protein [Pseudomonas kulmbachensis]|uniref:Uncharacterized protein n=1 Tax=Pseudomonas kulmbachensis TaxID=3043408 RepID=A0ABW7M6G8_9PSED